MKNNIFNNVSIETNRLILRNFTHEDKNDFYTITRDTKIYETLPEDHMYSLEEISQIIDWFIEKYDENTLGNIDKFPLAIILKDEQKLIGNIGIGKYSADNTKMEIFYFINSEYWNKGYVSEAVNEFINYIKKNKLVSSLIGSIVPKNIASMKILIKNDFKKIEYKDEYNRDCYQLKFIINKEI